MKLLIITSVPKNRYNFNLHQGFLFEYENKLYYEVDKLFDVETMVRDNNIDLVLLYRRKGSHWLKKFNCSVPVVLVDVDFFYSRNDELKTDTWVDLHLLRNPSDLLYSKCKRKAVLPHSFNPQIIYPSSKVGSDICFFGSCDKNYYPVRYKACETLNLDISTDKISLDEQVKLYHKHFAAITCSCKWHYLVAKHFEIPGCGLLLFTNGHNGVENYLPKNTYIIYKDDCSNLKKLWSDVQHNEEEWTQKKDECSEYVHKHHTHKARWGQFIDICNSELNL